MEKGEKRINVESSMAVVMMLMAGVMVVMKKDEKHVDDHNI